MHVTRKNARDNLTAKNARDNFWFARDKNRIFLPVTKKNARDIFGEYEKMPVTPQKVPVTYAKKLKEKRDPRLCHFLSEELCRRS